VKLLKIDDVEGYLDPPRKRTPTVSDTREHDTQPAPAANDRPCVWDVVVGWMRDRDQFGRRKYPTSNGLQPFNGRDALWDAIEEQLDHVAYLAQEWLQRREAAPLAARYAADMADLRAENARLRRALLEAEEEEEA
jgi:hypothetical protein